MSSYGRTSLSEGRVATLKARAQRAWALPSVLALAVWPAGCVAESDEPIPSEEATLHGTAGLGADCCGVPPANPSLNGLRLSITPGVAVPTADVTSETSAYLVAYESSTIALYDGIAWVARVVTGTGTDAPSVTNASTSVNSRYDVYAYWDGEKVVLEKEAAPATPTLVIRDGVHVKGNDPRRRYVGVVATNASGFFEDSSKSRLVWNRNNQVRRPIKGVDLSTWSFSGNNTWREVRNNPASRVRIASGVLPGGGAGTYLSAQAIGMCLPTSNVSNAYFATGIGIDSTSTNSAQIVELEAGTYQSTYAHGYAAYEGYLAPGIHTVHWLEIAMTGSFSCIGYSFSPPFGRLGLNGSVLM